MLRLDEACQLLSRKRTRCEQATFLFESKPEEFAPTRKSLLLHFAQVSIEEDTYLHEERETGNREASVVGYSAMAGLLGGADATAQLALANASAGNGNLEEPDHSSANWYFSRDEIEKQSPSRLDGIDIKKETYFRKSYCTFLQDLGMRLKV